MATTEMALRSRLVEARLASHKTQTAVAKALRCPQPHISKLETGQIERATFVDVVRLARIYGVPLTYLSDVVR